MKFLIESFYQSIIHGSPLPIPYREILVTARIMDSIFRELDRRSAVGLDRPEKRDHGAMLSELVL